MDHEPYQSQYSETKLQQKLASLPQKAGCKVYEQALLLYVLLTEKEVPKWIKIAIIGALGYLICPIDAVPDILPGGYLDDIAVMALVLAKVNAYETPGARERMEKLLPDRCRES